MYVQLAWQESTEELRARYRRETHGPTRLRLHALWLVQAGQLTLTEIGGVLGVSECTIRRWLNRYRTGGLAAVLATRSGQAGGAQAWLTVEQDALLAAYTQDGDFRTAAESRDWVAETLGVSYTVSGMRHHLRALGIHPKRPRPQHPKADPVQQDAWKKRGLTAALAAKVVPADAAGVVFADEMRCGLLGSVRQVWAPTGLAVRQRVQQERDNVYLHLGR